MAAAERRRSTWPWIPIVLATGIFVAVGAALMPAVDAFVVPTAGGVLVLLLLCRAVRPPDDRWAGRVAMVTIGVFVVHLVIGVVIHYSSGVAHGLASDATTYDDGARLIVAHWRNTGAPLPHLAAGKEGFYYSLAGLYWVVGPFPLAGLAMNAFFGAALVPLVFDLTRRLFGVDAAWWAALIVILQPGYLVWTSQLLREAGVLFFLLVAVSCAYRLATRPTLAPALLLAADMGVFLTFRADVALIVGVGLAIGITLGRRQIIGGFLIAATVLAMGVVLVVTVGLGRTGYQVSTSQNLARVSAARNELATTASSGFDASVNVSSPGRAVQYLPRGLPLFLWGPFPWQLHNVLQLFNGLDALTVIVLTPSLWRGWRAAQGHIGRQRLLLVLPAAALAMALTLLLGNYGTIVRERLQVLLFLVPLAGLGIAERRAERALETGAGTSVNK